MGKFTILLYLNTSRTNQKGTAPLLIRLTLNGDRKHLNTSLLLSPKQWNREKQVVKSSHPQSEELNKMLLAKKAEVNDAYYKIANESQHLSLEEFVHILGAGSKKEYTLIEVFEINNADIKSRISIDYSIATLRKYLTTLQKVRDYLNSKLNRTDIPLHKLDRGFIHDFFLYLRKEQGMSHNTVVKYAKNLKKIVGVAVMNGWLEKTPFDHYRIGYKNEERVYLSKEELLSLENKTFKAGRLNTVKDLFIFQCYTGLAYADMFKLTGKDISIGIDKNLWIITNRKKTDVRSAIPLLPAALNIIEKYNPQYKENGTAVLLPVYSNQKFNAYLHEIADICGIDKNLTSHVGRRTFATTVALANGVSIETISKVLGHSSTKITHQYAMTTDLKVSEEMNRLKEAL